MTDLEKAVVEWRDARKAIREQVSGPREDHVALWRRYAASEQKLTELACKIAQTG